MHSVDKPPLARRHKIFAQSALNGNSDSKGQLISKGLFDVNVSTKKPTIFLRISVLASKNSSNQKTLLYNYVK